MDSKAQTAPEFLLTYGWALLMIATIIGVMAFVTGAPLQEARFGVDDAGGITLKSGIVDGGAAMAVLQNISGGQIQITGIEETGNMTIGSCTIESGDATGETLVAGAGQAMLLKCGYTGNAQGTVAINYKNYNGEKQTAIVSIWS